jgi:hypothetical protein
MPLKLGATGITFHDNSVQTTAGGPVTTQYAIGSYVLGRPYNYTTGYNNTTVAGTDLYASASQGYVRNNEGPASFESIGISLVNIGSWRCVSIAPQSGSGANSNGGCGLWVRYA